MSEWSIWQLPRRTSACITRRKQKKSLISVEHVGPTPSAHSRPHIVGPGAGGRDDHAWRPMGGPGGATTGGLFVWMMECWVRDERCHARRRVKTPTDATSEDTEDSSVIQKTQAVASGNSLPSSLLSLVSFGRELPRGGGGRRGEWGKWGEGGEGSGGGRRE